MKALILALLDAIGITIGCVTQSDGTKVPDCDRIAALAEMATANAVLYSLKDSPSLRKDFTLAEQALAVLSGGVTDPAKVNEALAATGASADVIVAIQSGLNIALIAGDGYVENGVAKVPCLSVVLPAIQRGIRTGLGQ